MKLIIKSLSVIFVFTLLSGCASIVSKSSWPLSVNSTPAGAKVEITNKKGVLVYSGLTPATMSLKSGAGYFSMERYTLKFKMDGYDEKVIPVECKLNGWYIGNIVFGGLIGWLIVDPLTGAMYKLDAVMINETLSKSTAQKEPALKLVMLNDIPEQWKEHLVPIQY